MKKQILKACTLAAVSFFLTNATYGQIWNNVSGVSGAIEPNFGINDIRFKSPLSLNDVHSIRGEVLDGFLEIYGSHDANSGPAVYMYSNSVNTTAYPFATPGRITFMTTEGSGTSNHDIGIDFMHYNSDATNPIWTGLMHISKDGQVVIGDAPKVSVGDYRLYVQTGILTEKLKVATVGGGQWSDFVFAEDYKLRTLSEVENYISKNKHLPDVPSANEVEQNGYDITKMDATLLQKIEELTLHIIQQQKEIDELKSKLNK